MCHEFILQWSRKIDELNQANIKLVMISMGNPEDIPKLVDHLEIPDGYVFVGKVFKQHANKIIGSTGRWRQLTLTIFFHIHLRSRQRYLRCTTLHPWNQRNILFCRYRCCALGAVSEQSVV